MLLTSVAFAQSAESLLRDGLTALERGDTDQALANLESAAERGPDDFRPWMGLAQARRVSGDPGGAEDAINRALEAAPKTPQIAHAFAMYYAEGGEFDKAADLEARYARSVPDDRDVYLRTATWYLQAGRADLAAEFARSGLEKASRAELYDVLAKALAELGQIEEAERAFRAGIEAKPYDEDLRYNLGYLFLQAGEHDKAVEAFEQARAVFDKSPRIELGIGVARYGQRRFGEAIGAFLQVSRLAPAFEQPHYFLGVSLEHAAERLPEVRERLEAFAEARPGHYLGPFLLAKAKLAQTGPRASPEALEEAAGLLRTSIERQAEFWESHFELGVVLERMRRYQPARESLERAIELSPASTTPRYRLARVLTRLGERDAAREQQAKHDELVSRQRAELLGGMDSNPPASAPAR